MQSKLYNFLDYSSYCITVNGELISHREDGPAITYNDSNLEYWVLYGYLYHDPKSMPLNLFLAYCRWEYKKNGS